MSELVWFLVPLGALLWMAGGTWHKAYRRWAYPLGLCISLLLAGAPGWPMLWVFFVTVLATHLGYGDDSSWFERWVAGAVYGISVIPFGVQWSVLLMVSFVGLLWASRRWNAFPHKLVEFLHGSLHAFVVVWGVTRP